MSDPRFEFLLDPARKLLRITMQGHWDAATVAEYETEVDRAGERMRSSGCAPAEMRVLVDARDLSAQSQAAVAAYREKFGERDYGIRRLATLVSSALFKMQVQRIAVPNQNIFASEEEALNWLLSADNPDGE